MIMCSPFLSDTSDWEEMNSLNAFGLLFVGEGYEVDAIGSTHAIRANYADCRAVR